MPFKSFNFTVPSLPKPVYEVVHDLCREASVSQWHIVVAGVVALSRMEDATRRALIEHVTTTYTR